MIQILVYADSLSWGIIPDSRDRFRFDQRWPGIMEIALNNMGETVRVIEDCLNGRRTVWEDPFKPGRNGIIGIEQRIEVSIDSPFLIAAIEAPFPRWQVIIRCLLKSIPSSSQAV